MKVAVTTAIGALGSESIKNLIEETGGEKVIGVARTPEKASHLGIKIQKGDYHIKNDFDSALKGVGNVLFISGMDHPDMPVDQYRNVICAAKDTV